MNTEGAPSSRRVLLKLSGESLANPGETGVNMEVVSGLAGQLARAAETGAQLAVVVGGGNLIRGSKFIAGAKQIVEDATAHYMGMLGTVINALALGEALNHAGLPARVMSAIRMDGVAEPFLRKRCLKHLSKGRVVILAAGTGAPFVTTDTAAALRACEIGADVLLKATTVDGVYNADPKKVPDAVRYERLTYAQVLKEHLQVMDMTAIGLCMDNKIPVLVFNYLKAGNIERAVAGETVGTYVGV